MFARFRSCKTASNPAISSRPSRVDFDTTCQQLGFVPIPRSSNLRRLISGTTGVLIHCSSNPDLQSRYQFSKHRYRVISSLTLRVLKVISISRPEYFQTKNHHNTNVWGSSNSPNAKTQTDATVRGSLFPLLTSPLSVIRGNVSHSKVAKIEVIRENRMTSDFSFPRRAAADHCVLMSATNLSGHSVVLFEHSVAVSVVLDDLSRRVIFNRVSPSTTLNVLP